MRTHVTRDRCARVLLFALPAAGQARIRVMLLDGQNNHDWRVDDSRC